tara:strand:- start:2073 stop:3770 length:1698 start_codon:yes stop_codon:yes gene_type:complete
MIKSFINIDNFIKFFSILERKGISELRKYSFFRLLGGLLDSFYIFIITIIYSYLNPNSQGTRSQLILKNINPYLLILLIIFYILLYLAMQKYVYNLDYNLAVNTKRRILNKFDNLDQNIKVKIDQASFTSNLGPSFDLFHLNAITSFGMVFQSIGNLFVLVVGSIFLIGPKIIFVISVFLLIAFFILLLLKPKQLNIGKRIKDGQTELMSGILTYLRLLDKLHFLKNLKENIIKDIIGSDRKVRKSISEIVLIQIYSKSFIDLILLITIVSLLFIFDVSNSEIIILILLAVRFVPVFQNFINSLGKFNASSEVINSLYALIIQFKIKKTHNLININKSKNILSLKIIGKEKGTSYKTNFQNSKNQNNTNRILDLDISPGKRYSIIGKSGAGKSTLLKSIAGQNDIYKISTFITKDNELKNHSDITESMIYIPQEPQLLSGSALFNIVTQNDKRKINFERLFKALEISEFLKPKNSNETIEELESILINPDGKGISGGERQRLIIAQSIYLKPYFLLVDEGLCSLNNTVAQRVSRKIYYSDIPCVIYISHNDLNLDLWSNTITICN